MGNKTSSVREDLRVYQGSGEAQSSTETLKPRSRFGLPIRYNREGSATQPPSTAVQSDSLSVRTTSTWTTTDTALSTVSGVTEVSEVSNHAEAADIRTARKSI